MKKLFATLFSLILISASAAFAGSLDLTTAKSSGLVGERPDGLIAPVTASPSADVMDLVSTVNKGRMDVYQQSAGKQGVPPSEVAKIAAQKLYDNARPGDYLMIGGKWVQK
jgi:uncharacterized protein YdbL (DUF1318 family)